MLERRGMRGTGAAGMPRVIVQGRGRATMPTWSDPPFDADSAPALRFSMHDVPFLMQSNDTAVTAHVEGLVQRYRADGARDASGPPQVLVSIQVTPAVDRSLLTDVPRRSGAHKPARVATADTAEGRFILPQET